MLRHNFFVYIILLATLAVGCSVRPPQSLPEVKTVPVSYDSSVQSAPYQRISWKTWFTDVHLQQLIDSALRNNPDLLIAWQRMEQSKARLLMSRGARLPLVNAAVSASGDHYGDYTMNGVGNFDTNLSGNIDKDQKIPTGITPDFFVGFRSTWEIDIWGKLKDRQKAAAEALLATSMGRQALQTELVATVAQLYYDLMALDSELQIVNRNSALQEAAFEVVKVQKDAGKATELAVQQFRAQWLRTKAMVFGISQAITATENELNALCGRYPGAISRDSISLDAVPRSSALPGSPADLLGNRPDLLEASHQVAAAGYLSSAAGKAFFPSLSLNPYVGFNAFKAALLFQPASLAYGAFAGLTAPLFNRMQLKAEQAIAHAEQREAILRYQQRLLQAYREVKTLHAGLDNSTKAYQLKQEEVTVLQSAVGTARELYYTGYANYLEVISAQRGALDAELELTEQQRDILKLSVGLYRALGGGW
ncbi:TolC family protein [Flavihumibacter petaseus]|uniref:Putative RND-type efflux pump outer membrane protein n=1 Tax=Flavihumibacter petaseus NBRC 106054 TaxID=1220578 RepID=A0A0E9N3K9_9BACT|nr:TolC family protein [Flavihumibacter petaseus]GAO44399.1 putative RND-type efflux pump outer membrane protein [Flavihumibacter petaseus NBRC 106054]